MKENLDHELMHTLMSFSRKVRMRGPVFPPPVAQDHKDCPGTDMLPAELFDEKVQLPLLPPPFVTAQLRKIPLPREFLLAIIGSYPNGIRQKAVAEKMGIGQPSLSEQISKLESDGYVERKVDPRDRRATLLFLTEMGKARANEVEDERDAMLKMTFSALTEQEKMTLLHLLQKLL